MKIEPYQAIDGFQFGQTMEDAQKKFGPPEKADQSRGGQFQLHYPNFILRFNKSTKLFQEFTALSGCALTLNEKPVVWDTRFLQELNETDGDMVVSYGFVLSFKHGISISGFHDGDDAGKAIHVFSKGLCEVDPILRPGLREVKLW